MFWGQVGAWAPTLKKTEPALPQGGSAGFYMFYCLFPRNRNVTAKYSARYSAIVAPAEQPR